MKKIWDLTLYALFFTPSTSYFQLRIGKDSRFMLPRIQRQTMSRKGNPTGNKSDHDSLPYTMVITIIIRNESITLQ